MPDLFAGNFIINVDSAANPILGQNGQGVCAVKVHFDFEYLCDLSFRLTSPSGQTITLIGPHDPTCSIKDEYVDWNVTFLPCGNPNVMPDPGFTSHWDNHQNWGANGVTQYTGSYYPYNGCLQNFTGPVNGNWVLRVVDAYSDDQGHLIDFEIVFCDNTGMSCFACKANAGNLYQSDVTGCAGSPALNLNLPPTFLPSPPNAPQAPSPQYSYGYIVATPNIIQDINPTPDMRNYPPGNYTVCGFSYLTQDTTGFPAPGTTSINQFRKLLDIDSAIMCGSITPNCVYVKVLPAPPPVEEYRTICAPDCATFHGATFCQTGDYVVSVPVPNKCPYNATLHLTVLPEIVTTIEEAICPGACSQTPGFEMACSQGQFTRQLKAASGCDSTVILQLVVSDPMAVIVAPTSPPCPGDTLLLQGTGSSVGSDIGYQWNATLGGNLIGSTTDLQALAGAPGDYQLIVCRSGALTCCDTTRISVAFSPPPPVAAIPQGTDSLCAGATAIYTIPPLLDAFDYSWELPAGATLIGGQHTPAITVRWDSGSGGNVCVAAMGACGVGPKACLPVMLFASADANAGADGSVCGLVSMLQSLPGTGNIVGWSQISGPAMATLGNPLAASTGVTVPQPGAYTFQWTKINGSCTDADTVLIDFHAPPTLDPALITCDNTAENYTVAFTIHGGTSPYSVTGGTVTGSSFQSDPLSSGSSYTFMVTDNHGCTATELSGSHTCPCLSNAGIMSAAPLKACEGQTVTADLPNGLVLDANDAGAFILHTSPGNTLGTVIAQNTTGVFGFQTGMDYGTTYFISYAVGNALGGMPDLTALCSSMGVGQPIVFYKNPSANAGVDTAVCGLTLALSASTAANGTWSVSHQPNGATGTFSDPQNPAASVTASEPGTYSFIWSVMENGCLAVDSVQVQFHDVPALDSLRHDCDDIAENFTVTFAITGGTQPYTINGQSFSGNIFVSNPLLNGQSYTLALVDANDCALPEIQGAHHCACLSDAGTMHTTTLTACGSEVVSAQVNNDHHLDANDIFDYVLHDRPDATPGQIFARNTTGVFGFQTGMVYGATYYISRVVGNAVNGFPDPAGPCFSLAPGQPVIFYQNPSAYAGADTAVCGLMLSLSALSAAHGVWSVNHQPNGATGAFTDTQNPASGVTASQAGTYSFVWSVVENGCLAVDSVQVQFHDVPTLDSLRHDCDGSAENFTVTLAITGGTAPYTVNTQPLSGNIFVSNSLSTGQSYTLAVVDANGCTLPEIQGVHHCTCLSDAGTMSAALLTACGEEMVSAQVTSNPGLDANDGLGYVLHDNAGPVLGQVFAQNATGVFGFQSGMSYGLTYYISSVVGNVMNGFPDPASPCFSVAPGQPVIFRQKPMPQAGTDAVICDDLFMLEGLSGGFAGTWIPLNGPGAAVFGNTGEPATMVKVDKFGTYYFAWLEENAGCAGADTVSVTFLQSPEITQLNSACNGTNTGYLVTFEIEGGPSPYQINGLSGNFNGNAFTSTQIANDSSFNFQVIAANGCPSTFTVGSHHCDCTTDAGAMSLVPRIFCAGDTAFAIWDNSNGVLDADDGVQFILHDQPGTTPGTIFGAALKPAFAFAPGLKTGITYYISAVAGNQTGGQIDWSDRCLSVAPGTPILWKPLPTATLTGEATLCQGDVAILSLSGTGAFPLLVTYATGTVQNTVSLTNPQPLLLTFQPASTTTYHLLAVTDGTLPECLVNLNDAVTLTVRLPVDAGQALPVPTLCAGQDSLIRLSDLLAGAGSGGSWSEVSANPSTGGVFDPMAATLQTSGLVPGVYRFAYQLTADAPCPGDSAQVALLIAPLPAADAGANAVLTCSVPAVTLDGPTTSTGAGLVYMWTHQGKTVGNDKSLSVSEPGTYVLAVTSGAGCSSSDEAEVLLDSELPFARFIVQPVRCYNARNGAIHLDTVISTRPRVLFSLNGSPFSQKANFNKLSPGPYVLTLQDAMGCEWTTDTLWVTEPPLLSVTLGPDLRLALGDTAHLSAVVWPDTTTAQAIVWQPLLDSLHAQALEQTFMPLQSQRVTIAVTDANGCLATSSLWVKVNPQRPVFIPNSIRPGSPLNDRLTIFGGRAVAQVDLLRVYDRWGDQLFSAANFLANDLDSGWDGSFRGQVVAPGVYAYYAVVRFIDGETEVYTGDVTVIR